MAKKTKELEMEDKLRALYSLQRVYSEIDKIRTLRGELPLEVQDLEDEIAGLNTRLEKYNEDIKACKEVIAGRKIAIEESKALIEKYSEQQNNVRNNREYNSLSKEIEFQKLEAELNAKKIKEATASQKQDEESVAEIKELIADKEEDLSVKKKELEDIISETQAEEESKKKEADKIEKDVDERLLLAFKRIKDVAHNGLAVVAVERDACGGCFNKIPPQRQLDIRLHKKVIVCEYCGRILVDPLLDTEVAKAAKQEEEAAKTKTRKPRAKKTKKEE